MENMEFLQDATLQHTILVETLPTKVGQQDGDSLSIVTYFLRSNFHQSREL